MSPLLAAVDLNIIKDRIIHPDSTFAWALWKTIYIAVISQLVGVALGLVAALLRMSDTELDQAALERLARKIAETEREGR